MAAMGEPAPLDLRVNAAASTLDEARAALPPKGIEAEPTPYSPWGLRVAGRRAVTSGAGVPDRGWWKSRTKAASCVAQLVGAGPGMRVADWCAGAGGKTLAMAMTMENRGHIVACDVNEQRLEGAVKRLRRAGVHNVERHLITDGRQMGQAPRAELSTGFWLTRPAPAREHGGVTPTDAFGLTETDLTSWCPSRRASWMTRERLVRPGGRLIYATCSLLRWRKRRRRSRLSCTRHAGLRPWCPSPQVWRLAAPIPCARPYLVLTPLRHGTDGFFGAVLEPRATHAADTRP